MVPCETQEIYKSETPIFVCGMFDSRSNISTSNRYSLLETFQEQHSVEEKVSSIKQCDPQGDEIPTTVNGIISIMKPRTTNNKKNQRIKISPTFKSPINKISSIVRIFGDSHLRGMASKLNGRLNSHYKVSSIIKPGAKSKQITMIQDSELETLGKNDYLIIAADLMTLIVRTILMEFLFH